MPVVTSTPTPATVTDPNAGGNPKPGVTQPGGYTVIGRTLAMDDADPNHFRFSWEGVAIGVHFSGPGVSAVLNDIPATFLGHTGNGYYDVTIDGQLASTFHASPTQQVYPLAQNLGAGEHTVWVTKRTEGMIGSGEFHGITMAAGATLLAPPAHPLHRLEVLGASADTGYGVEATNCGGYNDFQQNQDKAWPQLTANMLGAELHNLAYSGKGVATNYDPVNDPTLTSPVLYDRADTNNPAPWDFSQWTAEVVVIDLGGNDYTGSGGVLDPTTFVPAYVAFIQKILAHYPKARVYVTLNPTDMPPERDTLRTQFQTVVQTCQSAGLTGVAFFEFAQYTGSTYGCDNHPDVALHQQMATALAAQIKKDLGW